MENTETSQTSASSESAIIRHQLTRRCVEALSALLPIAESGAVGLWNEDSVRTLLAVGELQRTELLAESEQHHELITNNVVARVIEALATRIHVADPRSSTVIYDLEAHLRLLSAMLRIYQFTCRSLESTVYDAVYKGITRLNDAYENGHGDRDSSQVIEDLNVAFLIQHCQNLLLSINSSESVSRKLAKRAIGIIDTALAGFGGQYDRIRPGALDAVERKRTRSKWHIEYTELEDACWSIFASDIRVRTDEDLIDIDVFIEEANLIAKCLHGALQEKIEATPKPTLVDRVVRTALGRSTDVLQRSGPFAQHHEYFHYGILDLAYQLTFRVRKRARPECFKLLLKMAKLVLDKSIPSNSQIHLKATDLYNRISILRLKDAKEYGDANDWQSMKSWIEDHSTPKGSVVEPILFSTKCFPLHVHYLLRRRSERLQRQLRSLRKEELRLLQFATGIPPPETTPKM